MSDKVVKQHYVPRMYLKRFSDDHTRLCVWNLMKDEILSRQRPENYAAKRFFYDANPQELRGALQEIAKVYPEAVASVDFSDEQFLEKALSRVESEAAKILDLICQNPEALYDQTNMMKLTIFLHELTYRSEKYRNSLAIIREQMFLSLQRLGISSEMIKNMSITAKDYQLYQLLGISPLLKTANMLIENYDWYIGIVNGPMKLLISDNPTQGIILGFNDICVPLSGDIAIIFRVNDSDAPILSEDIATGNIIKLSQRSVFAYNAVQLSYANRFVFGDKASLAFLKMITDRKGGYAEMFGTNMMLHPLI